MRDAIAARRARRLGHNASTDAYGRAQYAAFLAAHPDLDAAALPCPRWDQHPAAQAWLWEQIRAVSQGAPTLWERLEG